MQDDYPYDLKDELLEEEERHNEQIAAQLTIAFAISQSNVNSFSPDCLFNVYKEFFDKLEK